MKKSTRLAVLKWARADYWMPIGVFDDGRQPRKIGTRARGIDSTERVEVGRRWLLFVGLD